MPSPVHYLLQQTAANSGLVGLMNSAEFVLPLNDSGSGVVSLSLGRGAGAATFTRATTATTVLSSGLIGSVASGSARSYYDPTSLAYLGYLAEGSRVNLCLQSEDFGTSWNTTRATVSTNTSVAPDGASTADSLVDDASVTTTHFTSQTFVKAAANTTYTYSVWAKRGVGTRDLRILVSDNAPANGATAIYNTSTGAVISAAATFGAGWSSASSTAQQFPNGWWRFSLTVTSDATTQLTVFNELSIAGSFSYTGDGASSLLLWGAQLEAASFASSYIPTTTVAVTRNADSLSFTYAGNAGDTAGAVYAEVSTLWAGTAAARMQIFGGVNNNGLLISIGAADTSIDANDGSVDNQKTGLTSLATAVRKRAMSYGGVLMSVTGDGAAVATSAFDGGMQGGTTSLFIGCNGAVANNFYGTIKNFRSFLRQLPDATLQAITTT